MLRRNHDRHNLEVSSRPIYLITVGFSLLLSLTYLLGFTQALDNLFLDAYFKLRGQRPDQSDIILVKLDEDFASEYQFRLSDLSRTFYARAIENLSNAGANVIGMDIFFPERSLNAAEDIELANAILASNVVLPHVRAVQRAPGQTQAYSITDRLPFHPLLESAQRGVLILEESARYVEPSVRFSDGTLPSFSLAIIEAAGQTARTLDKRLIDYRGPEGSFPSLSFLKAYRNQFSYSEVQNKILILGVSLQGTDQDQILTPFGKMSGVEVNANKVYTLLYGKLVPLPRFLYALLLLVTGFLWPLVISRKWGLLYTIIGFFGLFGLSISIFFLELFIAPLWLALIPVFAYINTSYRHLSTLDKELSRKLIRLLDSTTSTSLSTNNALSQGFSSKGRITSTPDMLASLLSGLEGTGGLLIIDQSKTQHGTVNNSLTELANKTLETGKAQTQGTIPHLMAEPICLEETMVGVIALSLPTPPPPHLKSLIHSSIQTFSQLARYQRLKDRTTTLVDTLWPWRAQSSLDKLDALAMLSDLLFTERSWLGSLVETLGQAVFIMSPYGYGIYENAAARRLFKGEKNMLAAIPHALKIDREAFQKDYVLMVEQGDNLELGLTERLKERPVLLSLQVIRNLDDVLGVAGVISDVSQIEELDRKRQELISMVVHDLRSPLTSIQGFAEILLDEEDATRKEEQLNIIAQEAARMRRMTDAFLDVVKLESEAFEPSIQSCNLAELLRYGVATISTQAAQKDIIIAISAPWFLEMEADPDLISRLIINLLNNAVKYSGRASRIQVNLTTSEETAILSIKDHGYGMSEEQKGQLFQKYKRAKEGKAKATVGTGLGLYLIKLIIDSHHGSIQVDSELDKGSTFTIELPLSHQER